MRHEALLSLLKTLRFNGMLSQFDEIIEAGEIAKWTGIELIQRFLEIEIAYRQTRTLRYRLDMARLPQVKSLDNFDCSEMPVKKEQLIGLTECQFIVDKSNLLLIGGSGSGKTHIALAIAYAALQKLYRVKFFLFGDLARLLLQAKAHRYETNWMARLQRYQMLVIDEVGYVPIDPEAGPLLFEFYQPQDSLSLITITVPSDCRAKSNPG
jgi:DNA replication protein DnaC